MGEVRKSGTWHYNMLPEAEALAEGVSIDGYSTYRATRFADPI